MDRLSNLKNEKMAINNTDSRTTVPREYRTNEDIQN